MPSKTGIDSECDSYGLRNQDYSRCQGQGIIEDQSTTNFESRYQAGEDDNNRNDEEDVAANNDNRTSIIGSQLLESWRLRCCFRRHSDQGISGIQIAWIIVGRDELYPGVVSAFYGRGRREMNERYQDATEMKGGRLLLDSTSTSRTRCCERMSLSTSHVLCFFPQIWGR